MKGSSAILMTRYSRNCYIFRLEYNFGEIRRGLCMSIWQILGLSPSESDKKLKALVSNTYTNVNVVGRGTVNIDPVEVRSSSEFKEAIVRARLLKTGAIPEAKSRPFSFPSCRGT